MSARIDVSLISSGHDVADARLHRMAAALRRADLTVEVRALGQSSGAPPGVRALCVPRRGRLMRAVRAVTLPFRAAGTVTVTLDPDLAPAAYLRRVLVRRPLVVDVHEDYAALLADRSWAIGPVGFIARVVTRLGTAAAAHADVTVVADDHVPPARGRRRLVVRNTPDLSYIPGPSPLEPGPRAIYVGDVRASRGLWTMLRALEGAPDWTLDIVGPVSAPDRARLDTWLRSSPAGRRVRMFGRRPPREAWARASGAWVGLVLLDDTPAFRDAMPTKIYEYLAAGLAVLATPLPRIEALVRESGAGTVVSGAEAVSATLRRWSADPETVSRHRDAARAWAAKEFAGPSPYDGLAGVIHELTNSRRDLGSPRPTQR